MSTIFVQIASFRDPQLNPTLQDMIFKAKYPENLRIGICNQFSTEDRFNLDHYRNDDRFRIIDVIDKDSLGVCWARNQVQQLYSGETYTLQIDSHMRFEQDWDEILINMLKDLQSKGYPKPLLTGYVSSFDPDNDPAGRVNEPWRMTFDRFIPEGAVFFLPEVIPGWQEMTEPIMARFYSAHFCFTLGEFSIEVQHDPEYYFHGEEISVGVRAYTHGYDLFHPHRVVIWHEYTRKGRTKQWDVDKEWFKKNDKSHSRNRRLFSMDGEVFDPIEFGKYGFGTERTLEDYEKYAGIKFNRRGVQKYTTDKNYPPNPYNFETEEEYLNSFASVFKHCIDVHFGQVPEKDYDFWVVAFNDDKDETMFRQDADINEINRVLQDPDGYCKIWREFNTITKPSYWVVWPHSKSKGWCDRITGKL
jgi:glycosyltransferase involved in cell wall biosynthesis